MARTREGGGALKCSFCGKSQNDVRKLIAGPTVYICDECIELCNDIIAEEWEEEKSRELRSLPKPAEIKNVLDQPLRAIANNAGVDGAVVVNRVRQLKSKTEGYDADKDQYGDMLKFGVIDPAKVVTVARYFTAFRFRSVVR